MDEKVVIWQLGSMSFHGKTLVMTWIVMAALIIFCYLGVRKLTVEKPGKMQNVLEFVLDFIRNMIGDTMAYEKGKHLISYLVTLIMFILFSNMMGLLPNLTFNLFEHFHVEFAQLNKIFEGSSFMSPTADVNTTVALSLLTISLVFVSGLKDKGLHYFGHFVEPNPIMMPIHIIDFLSKPVTLGFRLFGNIFAGEILFKVMLMMPGFWVFSMILPDTLWLAFSIFIGCIQAYIFTMLTAAYIGQAVESSESH